MEFHCFLSLPIELRICVYKQLLLAGDIVIPENPNRSRPLERGHSAQTVNGTLHFTEKSMLEKSDVEAVTTGPSASSFSIAFVSRSVSKEFLTTAYCCGIFNVNLVSSHTNSWKPYLANDQTLKHIRHIRFVRDCHTENAWFTAECSREIDFTDLIKACPLIETVEVKVVLRERMLIQRECRRIPDQMFALTKAHEMRRNNVWDVPKSDWTETWLV